MADKHPYVTARKYLPDMIEHFRKSLPSVISVETLQRLGIAPKNESYSLNVLRYLGFIDENDNRTTVALDLFSLHDNTAFAKKFEQIVMTAYADLFELYGDTAWSLDTDGLVSFFRAADHSTDRVGHEQAGTFHALAEYCGHSAPQKAGSATSSPSTPKPPATLKKRSAASPRPVRVEQEPQILATSAPRLGGLHLNIQLHISPDASPEQIDRIFASIAKYLSPLAGADE